MLKLIYGRSVQPVGKPIRSSSYDVQANISLRHNDHAKLSNLSTMSFAARALNSPHFLSGNRGLGSGFTIFSSDGDDDRT